MSVRGDLSRKKILEVARGLFAAKGFSAVTMQDICDNTGLSRGGLYRHYASTEEVFADIIKEEQTAAFAALENAKRLKIAPDTILFGFLRSRIGQLLKLESSIDNATAEFAARSELGRRLLQDRAQASVQIITEILEFGVAQGVFSCENCRAMALHIMWCLEGMGKHNALFPVKEEIETQLGIIARELK
ncbi:MAG: TetR/AcrR family transcriptional regulator [Clostridia bacterium]|nr:TetR/AcrR family transcriptional regulator [Clostridia bacterium]